MTIIFINPLAANEQCHTASDILKVIGELVECFKFILPGIKANKYEILFDYHIEQRFLEPGINFNSSISKLSFDEVSRDIKVQWYLYTKNRAGTATLETCNVDISCANEEQRINGEISKDGVDRTSFWMSIGGPKINCAPILDVKTGDVSSKFNNFHNLETLYNLLPIYQAHSTKHRKTGYFDAERMEQVAPMPLGDHEAQRALLTSILYNKSRWAYCPNLKLYFCFKLTTPGKNVYHGYQIAFKELPAEVVRLLGVVP